VPRFGRGSHGDPAQRPERSREFDAVRHDASTVCGFELVDVAESLKRPADLFVHEALGKFQRRDAAGHPQRHAEVPCPPGHVLPFADQAGRYARHGPLPRTSL
jgi:hypothetical protein